MKYWRNWCIFFVIDNMCIEKIMELFNFGELKKFFRHISHVVFVGPIASGRKAWQEEEEETRKHISIVLILKEQLCISELFKDIQEAILLIPRYRTMWLFRAISSSTSIMSDVQSIYIPSSIRDWYLEVKTWTRNRQCSFSLWIPETKVTRILIRSTWVNRVMHNTCTKHGKDFRTQFFGSTSILLWGKNWSSIRRDRTQSFFMKHFQLIVFRKLSGWKLEKSKM